MIISESLREKIGSVDCDDSGLDCLVENPTASVIVITYNQVGTIRRCIESVMSQVVDFNYEVIIGDDGSSDGTAEVCSAFQEEHRDRVRLIRISRDSNRVILGRATGRMNILCCLSQARGRYLFFCEGDDYWLTNRRLSEQVKFLEMNKDVGLVYGRVHLVKEGGKVEVGDDNSPAEIKWRKRIGKEVYESADLIKAGNVIQTASVGLRSSCLRLDLRMYYSVALDFLMWTSIPEGFKIVRKQDYVSAYRTYGGYYTSMSMVQLDLSRLNARYYARAREAPDEELIEYSDVLNRCRQRILNPNLDGCKSMDLIEALWRKLKRKLKVF